MRYATPHQMSKLQDPAGWSLAPARFVRSNFGGLRVPDRRKVRGVPWWSVNTQVKTAPIRYNIPELAKEASYVT